MMQKMCERINAGSVSLCAAVIIFSIAVARRAASPSGHQDIGVDEVSPVSGWGWPLGTAGGRGGYMLGYKQPPEF